jgi:DNA polymerase III subunit beta
MIEVNRLALLKAIEPCARVAGQRSTMPILTHVLLEAAAGQLRYRATNLQHELSGHIAASADTCSFCVSAKDFVGALQSLDGDTVTMDLKKDVLTIKATGKRSFKLPTLPGADFPTAMNVGGGEAVLDAGVLPRLIGAVAFYARTSPDRPEQHVIRLDHIKGKLRAAATDGLGMAVISVDCDAMLGISIPLETARLLEQYEDEAITVVHSERAMAFQIGDVRFATKPPEGQFPPLEYVIDSLPKPSGTVTVEAEKLLGAVKAVRRAGNDLALTFGGGTLRMRANEASGEASDEIDVEGNAPELEYWVPADQLQAALGIVKGPIEIAVGGDELAPVRLSQGDWRTWVMPMRPDYVKSKKAA